MRHINQPSDSPISELLLDALQEFLESAYREFVASYSHVSNYDIIRGRWGALDVTLAWPSGIPNRNVHAWLDGNWPSYRLFFEGAAWEDSEERRERRFKFLQPDQYGFLEVRGNALQPKFDFSPSHLFYDVLKLIGEVHKIELDDNVTVVPLRPKPYR